MHDVPGARCLDLFAGTGALGLEALSRGAAHCDFVDTHPEAVRHLHSVIATLRAADRADVYARDALEHLAPASRAYDVVFLDPPFADKRLSEVLDRVLGTGALAPGGLVYVEHDKGSAPEVPDGLAVMRQKTAGAVGCALYRHRED